MLSYKFRNVLALQVLIVLVAVWGLPQVIGPFGFLAGVIGLATANLGFLAGDWKKFSKTIWPGFTGWLAEHGALAVAVTVLAHTVPATYVYAFALLGYVGVRTGVVLTRAQKSEPDRNPFFATAAIVLLAVYLLADPVYGPIGLTAPGLDLGMLFATVATMLSVAVCNAEPASAVAPSLQRTAAAA